MKTFGNNVFLILACFFQVVYGFLAVGMAVVLNKVVDAAGVAQSFGELCAVGLLAFVWVVVQSLNRVVAESLTQIYADKAACTLRDGLNRSILSMTAAGFTQEDTGTYINTITTDVLIVRDSYYQQIPLIVSYAAQFSACVIYSFTLNPIVALVLMGMSAVQYFVPTLFGGKINALTTLQSEQSARFTSKVKELFGGFSVIKTYGAHAQAQNDFEAANREMTAARVKTAVLTYMMTCTNMLIAWTMILLSILTAGYFVVTGKMSVGTLLAVFYIANRYSMPVMDFAGAYTKIRGSRGVREKIARFIKTHPFPDIVAPRAVKRGIGVKALRFAYGADAPALQDVTYTFEAGKKYLILGESGCGKSTLLKVIAGEYPAKGIDIDGTPREALPEGSLYGKLVLVGQQPYVFRRTVAENIDFLKTRDRKRLDSAVKRCCLDEFISTLPRKIDTLVDEEQRQLSGGQKARIGLARAIYAAPDVLLVDEATSALDADTALKIEKMLVSLKGTLLIHISHKPAPELMQEYDAILTMDAGRIISVRTKGCAEKDKNAFT